MLARRHQKITDQDAQNRLEKDYASGIHIAQQHLTPFLHELVRKHHYNRIEIASALLVLAYNALRKHKEPARAKKLFNILSHKAHQYIDTRQIKNLH